MAPTAAPTTSVSLVTRHLGRLACVTVPLLLLTGCMNLFSPIDSPSGDAQLLSAARAALDRGDFATASQDYQKLSGTYADITNSEGAYTVLDQYGAGMGAFASAFGTGGNVDPGIALTKIANAIGGNAGAATRTAIFQAFQLSLNITDNTELTGLVRLLTSFALIGEMLAESAATPGHLVPSDIVADPTSCISGGIATCTTNCSIGNATLANGAAATPVQLDVATAAQINAGPSLSLIQSGIDELTAAVTDIGGSNNSFASSISNFTGGSKIGDPAIQGAQFNCFRFGLLNAHVGSY